MELVVGLEPTTCALRIAKSAFYTLSYLVTNPDFKRFFPAFIVAPFRFYSCLTIGLRHKKDTNFSLLWSAGFTADFPRYVTRTVPHHVPRTFRRTFHGTSCVRVLLVA